MVASPTFHRGSGALNSSIKALENGAFETGEQSENGNRPLSSITGRLGGSLRDSGSPQALKSTVLDDDSEMPQEDTPLVTKPKETVKEAPALIVWVFPALTCAAAYAFYNIFIKKGSYTIHPILGGVILQFVAAILGTLSLGGIKLAVRNVALEYDRKGLMWCCAAGLAVGSAEMLSFCVSGMGVPATQSIPVIIGGSVLFGAILGLVMLGEVLMLWGWSGVGLLVVGIGLVSTDPGEKVEEGGGGAGGADEEPPIIVWIGPALVCATSYALYNIFIKKGSASINPILGGVVLQFVAAIFGTILLVGIAIYGGGIDFLNHDNTGIMWSCFAGIAVGSAELLSFIVSGLGTPVTQSIPTIIGGSVGFGAVLGILMLGESLEFQGWFGVALLMTGIGVVATDPGEKVAGH